jgi:hypothetical protein
MRDHRGLTAIHVVSCGLACVLGEVLTEGTTGLNQLTASRWCFAALVAFVAAIVAIGWPPRPGGDGFGGLHHREGSSTAPPVTRQARRAPLGKATAVQILEAPTPLATRSRFRVPGPREDLDHQRVRR